MNVLAANKNKTVKYNDIAVYLRELNYKVVHKNLVIEETLENVSKAYEDFELQGVIKVNRRQLKRAMEYHQVAQKIMETIHKSCCNVEAFVRELDHIDKFQPDMSDIEIPKCIKNKKLGVYVAQQSEEELRSILKAETDKLMNEGYFKVSHKDVKKSFTKLINMTNNQEFMEPKSILKVVANCHEYEDKTGYDLIQDYVQDIQMGDNNMIRDYLIDILPSTSQVKDMKVKYTNRDEKKDKKEKKCQRKRSSTWPQSI